MPPSESRIHESVRVWLASEGDLGQTSADLCDALQRVLARLVDRLGRVLGENGIRAILARSIRLRLANHPGFRDFTLDKGDLSTRFVACLQDLPADVARDAAVAVLITFVEVLVSLLGATLVWRLLDDIWPEETPPAAKDSEEVP